MKTVNQSKYISDTECAKFALKRFASLIGVFQKSILYLFAPVKFYANDVLV